MSKLGFISPFFIVSNLKESVSFYINKLGFELWHNGPDNGPYFAMVGRDAVSIMLKEIAHTVKPIPNSSRHEWARWDAYIYTEDPDMLFEELSSGGVTLRQPILDDGDGLRGFEVADADGYVLFFGRTKT